MKNLIPVTLTFVALHAMAQTAADSLSDSLHAPGRSIQRNFDVSRPIYLRAGSLVCQQWQLMPAAASDAAKADDSEVHEVLLRYKCAIASKRIGVVLMRPEAHSLDEMAEATYGYARVRWARSDGSFDYGFVGPLAIEN